jgi:hypothetical protein
MQLTLNCHKWTHHIAPLVLVCMLSKVEAVWWKWASGRRPWAAARRPLPSVLSQCTSSTVLQRMGTKFGANQNFLPLDMDTYLLMLDWATLSGLFRTPMWSNVVNKASHGLLGECRGPIPSLVAIGHKSRPAVLHPRRPALPYAQV